MITRDDMKYLSAKEVAKMCGVTYQAVYKAMKEGRLKFEKAGTLHLISEAEAKRWKKERKEP